jgi:26S proteasome regulatory subunit N2
MYHDEHLIEIIKMLIHSYNPYIRYGCAFALTVGARDSKEAIDLIWQLLTDPVDYVRQAAYMGIAILMQVQTAQSEPRLPEFRKIITDSMTKKHEEPLARMGAILATGLIDIGGRNMVVSLTTRYIIFNKLDLEFPNLKLSQEC